MNRSSNSISFNEKKEVEGIVEGIMRLEFLDSTIRDSAKFIIYNVGLEEIISFVENDVNKEEYLSLVNEIIDITGLTECKVKEGLDAILTIMLRKYHNQEEVSNDSFSSWDVEYDNRVSDTPQTDKEMYKLVKKFFGDEEVVSIDMVDNYSYGIDEESYTSESTEIIITKNNNNNSDNQELEEQYQLSMMYYNGVGFATNYERAIEILNKLALDGYAKAQYKLGLIYCEGKVVDQDFDKAEELFYRVEISNEADIQYELARLYFNGEIIEQNISKAIELLNRAAQLGEAKALYELGTLYYKGEILPKDYLKATEMFERANIKGNEISELYKELADEYTEKGEFLEAVKWYKKSVMNGLQLLENINLSENITYKEKCYEDSDYLEGILNLGINYYLGDGVEKNIYLALSIFNALDNLNYKKAARWIGDVYFENPSDTVLTINENKVLFDKVTHYYQKSYSDMQAQYRLGIIYELATEDEPYINKIANSTKYLINAANLGHEGALEQLIIMYGFLFS